MGGRPLPPAPPLSLLERHSTLHLTPAYSTFFSPTRQENDENLKFCFGEIELLARGTGVSREVVSLLLLHHSSHSSYAITGLLPRRGHLQKATHMMTSNLNLKNKRKKTPIHIAASELRAVHTRYVANNASYVHVHTA